MPWLYSYAGSEVGTSVLILDSKNGEVARQTADMLADLGLLVAVIDDLNTWPECRHRINLNPFDAATSVHSRAPEELIYALDKITHALIEEPADGDARNRYFRAWPRLMIEFAISVLLSCNPSLRPMIVRAASLHRR
jgi:type IV secretion system protein VirD4